MDLKELIMGSKVLFKDFEVFSENYIPERILGREEQIRELVSYLKYVVRGQPHSNIVIYGKSGSGKSTVVLYILRELRKIIAEDGIDVRYRPVYVLCRDYRSEGQIIEQIVSDLRGERVTFKGWSISSYYEKLRDALSEVGGVVTVVLDEANLMSKPNELLYNLSRIYVPKTFVCLICISNAVDFIRSLESRVLSSLQPIQIVFPPYTAEDLAEILRDRAQRGLVEGALDEGVIELCAAIAAQSEGDARKAIALLKTAVQVAENEGSDKVTVKHVKEALEVYEKDIVKQTITTLPLHHKAIILSVVLCIEAGLHGSAGVRSGHAYIAYKNICRVLGIDPYTQRRFTDFLNELKELELVRVRYLSYGKRKGRAKVILLEGNPSSIKDAIIESERFSGFDYQTFVKELRKLVSTIED